MLLISDKIIQEQYFDVPSRKWSASALETYNSCGASYYYTHNGIALPTPSEMTLGKLIHSLAQNFWNEKEEPKYKSRDSFKNAAVAQWNFIARLASSRGQPTKWRYQAEPYVLRKDVAKTAEVLYDTLIKRGQPPYVEGYFDFFIKGVRFVGSIDELRKNATIIDHKNYPEDYNPYSLENKEILDNKIQFTLYALAVAANAYLDPEFASDLGIEVNKRWSWEKSLEKINSQINLEMHLTRKGEFVPIKRRRLYQFDELINLAKEFEKRIASSDFPTNRGEHCRYCIALEPCAKDTANDSLRKPTEGGQVSLFKEIASYPEPVSLKPIRCQRKKEGKEGKQLRFPFMKELKG